MKKRLGWSGCAALVCVLVACATNDDVAQPGEQPTYRALTGADLHNTRWILDQIDGDVEQVALSELRPELAFDDQDQVSGNSGCNQLRGMAEWNAGTIVVRQLVSTRRMCSPASNEVERRVIQVLSVQSQAMMTEDNKLKLISPEHTLVWLPRDGGE